MTSTQWKDYLALLTRLSKTLEQLSGIERRKTEAVCKGNLSAVEDCMKQEQVYSMSLRGLDQKRDKMLAAMGMTGVPLSKLLDHAPEEHRLETKQVAEELRRQYTLFQTASEVARSTLECNLHEIERIQIQRQGDVPTGDLPRQTDFRV